MCQALPQGTANEQANQVNTLLAYGQRWGRHSLAGVGAQARTAPPGATWVLVWASVGHGPSKVWLPCWAR